MKTFINRIALFTTAAVVLGTAAFAQDGEMRAQIPFAFHTSTGSLPAGEYAVGRLYNSNATNVLSIRNTKTHAGVFTIGNPNEATAAGSPALVFRCDSAGCALAAVRTSRGTVSYNTGRKHGAASEVATIAVPLRTANGD